MNRTSLTFRVDRNRGFTLVEISIVLIVIGLIISAVSLGRDLQRNASYQQLNAAFVQGWVNAYQNYYNSQGIVLGDDPASPTSRVNEGGAMMCDNDVVTEMQQAGVQTPTGRGPGNETVYAYLDSSGIPQQAEVCFANVDWTIPDGFGGFLVRERNVMILTGITPDLARRLDSQIDGRSDARFGSFRENTLAASTSGTSQAWSKDNTDLMSIGAGAVDEAQIAVLSAYYLMSP